MALHVVAGELAREQKIKVAYSAWLRGDEPAALAMFTEDCEFTLVGNPVLNPHSGPRAGLRGIRELMRLFRADFAVREFIIEKIIVSGDDAAVHWHTTMEYLPTGRIIQDERCDLIAFRGGLVRRVLSFYDSASMAVLTGRAQAPVAEQPVALVRGA